MHNDIEIAIKLGLASFSLLANYLLIKLNNKNIIKLANIITKNCKYLIFRKNLPKTSFDLFCAT